MSRYPPIAGFKVISCKSCRKFPKASFTNTFVLTHAAKVYESWFNGEPLGSRSSSGLPNPSSTPSTVEARIFPPTNVCDRPWPLYPSPAWIVPGAIAAVGLIVAGALGYLVYSTTQQRDALHIQLVATKTTLASTQATLTAAQTEAASRKVTADYVALYVGDQGKVQTDYQNVVNCSSYSECRTAAQQMLSDMQAFQSDRKSANVPSAMTSIDSSLGDSLSAAIASDQEFITGMDNDDAAKIKDGFTKLGAAMLNVAKAESSIGTELN